MTATVTIGMPVRNGAEYVEEAIKSLLAQTETDFILHISDNCSEDETPTICARLAAEDERILYERQACNRGIKWNFEHLFLAARSPFFMWAAHDDLRDPTFLETSLRLLRAAPDAAACAVGLRLIDNMGAELGGAVPPPDLASANPVARSRAVTQNNGFAMVVYGLMRRENLPSPMHFGDYAASDIALTFSMALNARIVVIDEPLLSLRVLDPLAKREGESAHMYAVDRPWTQMCRTMTRDINRASLRRRDKTRLRLYVAEQWLASAQRAAVIRNNQARLGALVAQRLVITLLRFALHLAGVTRVILEEPGRVIPGIRRRIASAKRR